jgi:hypothetical protein
MSWIENSPSDLNESHKSVFKNLTGKIPVVRGWFGVAVQKVEQSSNSLQTSSTAGSIFAGLAKALSRWTQAVLEVKQSIFITPPISKGNRWVEHVRNTYRDYGLNTDLNSKTWEQKDGESVNDYQTRLAGYADELINIFKKHSLTAEALKSSLKPLLPQGTEIQVVEPSSLTKPWPGPDQYRAHILNNESEGTFLNRLKTYQDAYKVNFSKVGVQGSRPNTMYPLPPESQFASESSDQNISRVNLLKSDLGSYTILGGTSSNRTYPDVHDQGGWLEITLPQYVEDAYNKLVKLKAAGVNLVLYINNYLGTAENIKNDIVVEVTSIDVNTSLGLAYAARSSSTTYYVR